MCACVCVNLFVCVCVCVTCHSIYPSLLPSLSPTHPPSLPPSLALSMRRTSGLVVKRIRSRLHFVGTTLLYYSCILLALLCLALLYSTFVGTTLFYYSCILLALLCLALLYSTLLQSCLPLPCFTLPYSSLLLLQDFGSSKEDQASLTFCGTTRYMAPERLNGIHMLIHT